MGRKNLEKTQKGESKVGIVRGFTPKVLITWLILHVVVFTIINIYGKGLLRTHTYITATRTGIPWYPPWGFYFTLCLIIVPLSLAVAKRLVFSKQELAILFALMVMSLDTAIMMDTMSVGLWYRFIPQSAGVNPMWIPSFFAPTERTLIEGTLLGKASVPWGPLMPFIAYWIVYFIAMFAFSLFCMEILRKKFIEVDRLSYPGVRPSFEVIRMATEIPTAQSKPSRLPSMFNIGLNKYFYIGFFTLGLGFGAPSVLAYTFPELGIPPFACAGRFPVYPLADFFAANTWHIVGDARWVPTDAFLMYLVPMDILATLVIYQIISYIIYPIIGTATGIMAPGVPGATYQATAGPFRTLVFAAWVMVGLGIWVPILSWRYIKDSLTGALKRAKAADGGVPSLWGWAGAVLTGLVLVVLGASLGAPAALLLLWVPFLAIMNVGRNYFYGEGWPIGYVGWDRTIDYGFARHVGSAMGLFPTPATATAASWGTGAWYFGNITFVDTSEGGGDFPMVNYKLGDMTETRPREMFNAMLIASVLIPLISVPVSLWLYYMWGVEKILTWYGPKSWQVGYVTTGLTGVTTPYTYWDPTYQVNIVASIIITGVLMVLRLRLPWFFINPIGICCTYVWRNMTEAFPILIIKYLTLRIGGAKAYERIGVPIIIGALVGLTFWIGLGMIILHFRTAAIAPPY